MFSFGLIKVQTTINGGIAVIREKELFDQMSKVQDTYPVQSKKMFFTKTLKALFAKSLFGTTMGVRFWHNFSEKFYSDREEATISMVRGFSADQNFLQKFRINPSPILLNFMLKRFNRFD